jgi:hypothetical protein
MPPKYEMSGAHRLVAPVAVLAQAGVASGDAAFCQLVRLVDVLPMSPVAAR